MYTGGAGTLFILTYIVVVHVHVYVFKKKNTIDLLKIVKSQMQ